METFINAWGKDGCQTASAVLLLTCLGMFRNLIEEKQKIRVRFLNFGCNSSENQEKTRLENAFTKYYQTVFGEQSCIVCDTTTMTEIVGNVSAKNTIRDKISRPEYLFLGCSDSDMKMNFCNGLCGRTSPGDIFYEDAVFDSMYKEVSVGTKEVAIINCGSCRGDAVASVFIPKEIRYDSPALRLYRYIVLSGELYTFSSMFHLPFPDIYSKPVSELSIFDIEENKTLFSDTVCPLDYYQEHKENLKCIDRKYDQMISASYDYCSMNPAFDMELFLDTLCADRSRICSVFINLRTDGYQFLPRMIDFTLLPGETDSQMHILHLLNAISIREIIKNPSNYNDGKVYAFGNGKYTVYTLSAILPKEGMSMFQNFLVMAILITYYLIPCFKRPDTAEITEKWANMNQKKGFLNFYKKESIQKYEINQKFCDFVVQYLVRFHAEYLCSVLDNLLLIDSHSDRTELFPKEIKLLLRKIILPDSNIEMGTPLEITEKYLMSVLGEDTKVKMFMKEYIKQFPLYAGTFSHSDAEFYFKRIIRNTMQMAEGFYKEAII